MARNDYEAPDMSAMLKRIARAMVRRAEEGDLEALSALRDAERAMNAAVNAAGIALHDGPFHYSWNELARELGVSRARAQFRFTHANEDPWGEDHEYAAARKNGGNEKLPAD